MIENAWCLFSRDLLFAQAVGERFLEAKKQRHAESAEHSINKQRAASWFCRGPLSASAIVESFTQFLKVMRVQRASLLSATASAAQLLSAGLAAAASVPSTSSSHAPYTKRGMNDPLGLNPANLNADGVAVGEWRCPYSQGLTALSRKRADDSLKRMF